MSAISEARKDFSKTQALSTAWVDFIDCYETGNLSLNDYCNTKKLVIDEAELVVSPDQFLRMRRKLKETGSAEDRRKHNTGRPGSLSTYCKYAIFEDYLNFEDLSIEGHLRLLNLRLKHDRALSVDSKGPHLCTYDQVRRFRKTLPEIYKLFAKKGYKAVREKFGPIRQKVRYVPGQLWVVDTVTLKQTKFRFMNDSCEVVVKSPQYTYILDIASTGCVYGLWHWDDADSGIFIKLLQGALLPARRHERAQSDAFPIFDPPVMLLSDKGSILHNAAVIHACHDLGIAKLRTNTSCPEENSQAETFAKAVSNAFQEEILFSLRKLVPADIEVSDLAETVERSFYDWASRYNQSTKQCREGLSPIEHYQKWRPHCPLNPRTPEEIVAATMVAKPRTAVGGLFSYNGENYRCAEIGHLGKVEVVIKADPHFRQPSKIEVYLKGKLMGIATNDAFDATGMTERPDLQDEETTARFKGQFDLARKLKSKTPTLELPEQDPASSVTTKPKTKHQATSPSALSSDTLDIFFDHMEDS